MALTDYPLPIIAPLPDRAGARARLAKITAKDGRRGSSAAPTARHATAPVAAMLLDILTEEIEPSEAGRLGGRHSRRACFIRNLRRLEPQARPADRSGARARQGQSASASMATRSIAGWRDLFDDDAPAMRRLRLTACLLADVAWQADPEFRAERAIEAALHGNWFGVDARWPGADRASAVLDLRHVRFARPRTRQSLQPRGPHAGASVGARDPPGAAAVGGRRAPSCSGCR